MSLIEEVMRRNALERAAQGGAAPPRVARPLMPPPVPVHPATPPPRTPEAESPLAGSGAAPAGGAAAQITFRSATLDPESVERNRVLLRIADVGVSRAYKILRTRVLHRMTANNWYSLGVTGSAAGEGKTLTAINLALALAQDVSTHVFLVDLDLQRPQLGSYLGMRYEYGLTDYLTGQADLSQVVYDIGVKRLAVVPNASSVENSSELLRSPRAGEFLAALEASSPRRLIVFDMPPLMVSDDVISFAPRVDTFLMVVSQGRTARRTLDNAREVLSELNLMGVVLNRSTERNDSPYY